MLVNGPLPPPPMDPMAPQEPPPILKADVSGSRFWAGGLLGLMIGVKPIWVAVELDAAYQAMSANATFPAELGAPSERKATFSGVTVAPTGAIIGKFW
jgi:hypothetical protein